MILKKCDYCGKEVKIYPYRQNQEHIFCNKTCYKHFRETNEYIKCKDYYKIIVNTPKYGMKEVLIDVEDYEKVKNYHWYIKDDYVTTNIKCKERGSIRIHRLILNYFDNKVIDHINHNTLDNRKCNLCIVSKSENQQNLKPNKYGCRGIYKSGKKFKASIRVNQKDIYLGTFENIEGAINARKNAELIYWTHPKKLQIIKGDNNE